ncbi:LAFE_0E07822g1_1 [Lachancea fermentati]|uniref:LAFE_0E07822g1_1 n=1 Tax=Lachancea fermentati TaxID=4955 RepID=A0A1G4MD17_LACFM|nr:LAFE_0E07822g1_1 [Lachancea fermentati]
MSSNLDDFEDLDDYLEDPSKLDEEAEMRESDVGNVKPKNNDDPEVTEMIDDLQSEFAKLMKEDGGEANKETVESFKQLLGTLTEAGSSEGTSQGSQIPRPSGFKDIVSNTLDRLKENSNKVDTNLVEEKKRQNTDDILSQLLDQLVDGTDEDGEGVDNAILNMLNQMSSKEVLYQPMKDMHTEYTAWMDENRDNEEHADKIDIYKQQYGLVERIVAIYEKPDYSNEKYREEIATLLDDLEKLGDSPVNKGFGNQDAAGDDVENLAKMLEIDGDENIGDIDKELQDTCKQQ